MIKMRNTRTITTFVDASLNLQAKYFGAVRLPTNRELNYVRAKHAFDGKSLVDGELLTSDVLANIDLSALDNNLRFVGNYFIDRDTKLAIDKKYLGPTLSKVSLFFSKVILTPEDDFFIVSAPRVKVLHYLPGGENLDSIRSKPNSNLGIPIKDQIVKRFDGQMYMDVENGIYSLHREYRTFWKNISVNIYPNHMGKDILAGQIIEVVPSNTLNALANLTEEQLTALPKEKRQALLALLQSVAKYSDK